MIWFIYYAIIVSQPSSSRFTEFDCNSTESCYDIANQLQIGGTQQDYAQSNALLYNSVIEWPNDASLWGLYGKLNLFYTLSWSFAFQCINNSLSLDPTSYNNSRSYLYAGWLHSTSSYLDTTLADNYFQTAINFVVENNDTANNFWPYFEYAAFLSHIMNKYNESKIYYDIADNLSPNNPFINFFYGLLLKYHLNEEELGENKMQQAIDIGPYLPGQAAGNLIFQSILLKSRNKYDEHDRCCEFSMKIIDPKLSGAHLYCLNDTNLYIDHDENDDVGDESNTKSTVICLWILIFILVIF